MTRNELLRRIPKVDDILSHVRWQGLFAFTSGDLAKEELRSVLDALRAGIKEGLLHAVPSVEEIIDKTAAMVAARTKPGLRRVINGTGVIIHTNLGRSLLSTSAAQAIQEAASRYSNLEYDLEMGERGDRYEHSTSILRRLTGAEGALVVNNNAAAVYLVLNTMAEGKEVVVSRGELIEIGGSFRIPDVMRKSGAILREVGTTNRTYVEDYERAIGAGTGLLMKAHPSNFRIHGFIHEPDIHELADLGRRYGLPVFFDAGSGLLTHLPLPGVAREPVISDALAAGIDIVSFSGDKLLGAPQAGIIVGREEYIEEMKRNPMTRAFRPDKFTLAGLESTLLLYLDKNLARREVPTLRMILEEQRAIKRRAARAARRLKAACPRLEVEVVAIESQVGGGTLPDVVIPSAGLSLAPGAGTGTVAHLEERLRRLAVPVVGRIEKERFLLDFRTILPDEDDLLISNLQDALKE